MEDLTMDFQITNDQTLTMDYQLVHDLYNCALLQYSRTPYSYDNLITPPGVVYIALCLDKFFDITAPKTCK